MEIGLLQNRCQLKVVFLFNNNESFMNFYLKPFFVFVKTNSLKRWSFVVFILISTLLEGSYVCEGNWAKYK